MKSALIASPSTSSHIFSPLRILVSPPNKLNFLAKTSPFRPNHQSRPCRLLALSAKPSDSARFTSRSSETSLGEQQEPKWNVQVGDPRVPSFLVPASKLTLNDQAFFLLSFIACTTSVAFASLVVAAVPTLHAMGRAAISLSKLADTAREELPSTMAAVRLSSMEISDLTLELSDLSQEIADGVNKSAQAVQAAEDGVRRIGALAQNETVSMIQEKASVSIRSWQPVVSGAAKKTTRAVGKATKTLMNIISGDSDDKEGIDI